MNTKLLIIIVPIVFLFASCEQKDVIPYEPLIRTKVEIMNMERPKDSYNYPVYPGMKAWVELATGEEQVKACQVPEDVLKTMSTQAVIQALWEYPLLVKDRLSYQLIK